MKNDILNGCVGLTADTLLYKANYRAVRSLKLVEHGNGAKKF